MRTAGVVAPVGDKQRVVKGSLAKTNPKSSSDRWPCPRYGCVFWLALEGFREWGPGWCVDKPDVVTGIGFVHGSSF